MPKQNITLVGAGLAGSLLSVFLAKRGFHVDVYERRPDMRKTKISAGRSINLALSTRGIHALQQVGLRDPIMEIAIPMKGRMVHALNGEQTLQRYGKNDSEVIYSVSRGQLNASLMDLAEDNPNVRIHFDQRCTGMDFETNELKFVDENSKKSFGVPAGVVLGTDGSASALRIDMQKYGRFNFSQNYLNYGYKELSIPPAPGGAFLLEKNALHIWPRKTFMLIALPNIDGSFTCTLFYPFEGPESFEKLTTPQEVTSFFETYFPDALPMMPTLTDDFFNNPTGALVTVHCSPWHVDGKAALLGDAAHAMVPFFGQGMNCAFEDCVVLDECIARHAGDWGAIFAEYQALRKINADAIAQLALENFIEMRDLVADPKFILKKKIEKKLEDRFPESFIPKYSMVSFHRMPYSEALRKGKIQDEILNELAEGIADAEKIDYSRAEILVREKLK